jgi:hypothetical protein
VCSCFISRIRIFPSRARIRIFPSRIQGQKYSKSGSVSKKLRYYEPKKLFLSSGKWYDLHFDLDFFTHTGSRGQKGTGSCIPYLDPQRCNKMKPAWHFEPLIRKTIKCTLILRRSRGSAAPRNDDLPNPAAQMFPRHLRLQAGSCYQLADCSAA